MMAFLGMTLNSFKFSVINRKHFLRSLIISMKLRLLEATVLSEGKCHMLIKLSQCFEMAVGQKE
jgi:hypothetical protein